MSKETFEPTKILSPRELYTIGKILKLCVTGSKSITTSDSFQYAFKYSATVDYSDKKFDCSMAKAAHAFFELQSKKDKEEVNKFIEEMEKLIMEYKGYK